MGHELRSACKDFCKEWQLLHCTAARVECSGPPRLRGSGEAFGYYESSSLHLWGDERFAEDTDSWLNFNSDGWPDGYDITAEYIPGYGTTGTVRVIVTVDDYMHPNSYDTVYSCDHEITWE